MSQTNVCRQLLLVNWHFSLMDSRVFSETKSLEQTLTGPRTSWPNHAETSSCLFEKQFALTQAHLANDSAFAGVAVGRFSLGSAKHQTQQEVSNPTRRFLRIERQTPSQHFQFGSHSCLHVKDFTRLKNHTDKKGRARGLCFEVPSCWVPRNAAPNKEVPFIATPLCETLLFVIFCLDLKFLNEFAQGGCFLTYPLVGRRESPHPSRGYLKPQPSCEIVFAAPV